MARLSVHLFILFAVAFLSGCSGKATTLHMKDAQAKENIIVFPNGTIFGGHSSAQASTLAKILVDSHNMSMQEAGELREMAREAARNDKDFQKDHAAMKKSVQQIEKSTQQIVDSTEKIVQLHAETADRALKMIELLSRRQGTGEITLFFPTGSGKLNKHSVEYQRLVNFVDYLARENMGKKLLFISIGCASATGDKKLNQKLAKDRAEFPIEVIGKYLINTPHEFYKVYGVGDSNSPEDVEAKEHHKYQHARLIALYETDRALNLPSELAAERF